MEYTALIVFVLLATENWIVTECNRCIIGKYICYCGLCELLAEKLFMAAVLLLIFMGV